MIGYSEPVEASISTLRGRIGTAYLLLALFAGLLGGGMTLPFVNMHPTAGLLASHAILMGFFVVVPGILGGLAYWLLPHAIGTQKMALPFFAVIAWLFLATGVIILPLWPVIALMFWAVGTISLSIDIIATILENRTKRYSELPPMVWAFLFNAITLVVVAPVVMALLVKGKIDTGSASSLMQFFQIPELSLLLLPAFGMIAQALLPERSSLSMKVAPYLLGVLGFVAPLLWVKNLFCGFLAHNVVYIISLTQLVPALLFLVSLCISLWRASFRQSPAPYWAVMAMLLLLAGNISALLSPSHYSVFSAMGDVSRGHQFIVFGSLMALCAGFYAWMAQKVPFFSKGYLELGVAHAIVTFAAMLCFMLPQAQLFAIVLSAVSLVVFVLMGFLVCVNLKKRQGAFEKRSFAKG